MRVAIRDTIRKYKGQKCRGPYKELDLKMRKMYERCPLCYYVLNILIYLSNCDSCPWVIFTGYKCIDTKNNYHLQSIGDRIERLQMWESILSDILGG
jgi:hypothetical protein